MLEQVIDFGKGIGLKVSPTLDWISVRLADLVDISPDNIHLLLILVISIIIAGFIAGKDRFGTLSQGLSIKFWVVTIGLFLLFKYLGF